MAEETRLKDIDDITAILGGGEAEALIVAMERAASFIRQRMAQKLSLKYVPKISFQADRSFDYADRIGALLKSSAAPTGAEDKA